MVRAATRARLRDWQPIEIPEDLRHPMIEDYVTTQDVHPYGWPTPEQVDVRSWRELRHPLALLALQRYKAAVLEWRSRLIRDGQYPGDAETSLRIGTGAIWPRLADDKQEAA